VVPFFLFPSRPCSGTRNNSGLLATVWTITHERRLGLKVVFLRGLKLVHLIKAWKMISFLFKQVIFMFHVNFPGLMQKKTTTSQYNCLILKFHSLKKLVRLAYEHLHSGPFTSQFCKVNRPYIESLGFECSQLKHWPQFADRFIVSEVSRRTLPLFKGSSATYVPFD